MPFLTGIAVVHKRVVRKIFQAIFQLVSFSSLCYLIQSASKGHILFFHDRGTRSHIVVLSAAAQALVDAGFEVTTVFYAKTNIVHENYNEIIIEDR